MTKSSQVASLLPLFLKGKVVKGFGRGSKSLGIPTANYDASVVEHLPPDLPTGVYFGWAKVSGGAGVYKCCLSIGWNPYFGNKTKSVETHIIHQFQDDFYGSSLSLCITGYLRDEMDFSSIDELKAAINNDIQRANAELDKPEFIPYSQDNFFTSQEEET